MTNEEIRKFLNQITKDDILKAFIRLDNDRITTENLIRYYIIKHQGKTYPPPEVLRLAYENSAGEELPENFFVNIGERSEHFKFIRELGFELTRIEGRYKFYIKRLLENELGYRNGVPTTGETFMISKEAAWGFFPTLSTQIKNENKKLLISNKSKGSFHEITYTFHNDKYFNGTRNEYRLYLTSELLSDFRKIVPTDIVVISSTPENENEYEIEHFKKGDNNYQAVSELLGESNHLLTDKIVIPITQNMTKPSLNIPLNQILFGPPGTGKTDATVEKALEILELKTDDRTENRELFRALLNKKIFFVTMHPSYSYEDFVQGIKPKTSVKSELLFEQKAGIFKNIAELSLPYIDSYYLPGFLMSVYEEDVRAIVDPTMNQQQLLEYIGNKCGVAGGTIKNIRDYFDNVVGSISLRVGYSDENFIANNIDKEFYVNLSKQYLRTPKNMLLNSFKNNWVDKSNVVISQEKSQSNFVLILDEINRANISKVFGELITLLEEDKRIGKDNELSVTLPSGEIFSVPPNLYVIGTMNTADKSIALVDIALRRRFQFIPVYPDSSVITNHCKSADKEQKSTFMDLLNAKLRIDKGVDFQIGHAYFLKDNLLKDVINENVIPLLTEYYRNDLEKVKKLLSDLGEPLDEDHYNKTGLLKYNE